MWDYMAVTVMAAGNWREAVRPEVERRRAEGWQLEEVCPAGLDAGHAAAEDRTAGEEYVCIFRRPTRKLSAVSYQLSAVGG